MANTYSLLAAQSHEYAAELRLVWACPKFLSLVVMNLLLV